MPRFLQVAVGFLLIIASLPIFIFAMLMSSIFVGFPPFYRSTRVGLNGRTYRHLKLRTMTPGAETGRVFFEADRLNWCGRMLRKLHLDEIPELVHVAGGTMNLVGPRPLPSNLLTGLDTSTREAVRPGWTGPAQVVLARKGRLGKKLQIRLDNHYVKNRSTTYDIKIILASFRAIMKGKPLDMGTASSKDRIEFGDKLEP